MPRKRRTAQEIAQEETRKAEAAGRSTPAKRTGSRKDRSTASSKAGTKRTGTKRATASEIAARNAHIVRLREVDRLMWSEIGVLFGIDEKTARRGYDAHIEGRQYEQSFENAMRDMREYVAVLVRHQQLLARIAYELDDPAESIKPPEDTPPPEGEEGKLQVEVRVETRTRIMALHEQVDLMLKEIALRQAIGDLPARFSEMTAARDFEWAIEQIMLVLKEHDQPRKVFVEIEKAMRSRTDVAVPKTHLASVG